MCNVPKWSAHFKSLVANAARFLKYCLTILRHALKGTILCFLKFLSQISFVEPQKSTHRSLIAGGSNKGDVGNPDKIFKLRREITI